MSDLMAVDINTGAKEYQRQIRDRLKASLELLPAPRNDFEIVVPEDETLTEQEPEEQTIFPDQAEIDANRESELKAKREQEMKRRSQVVQRDLPRPYDITIPLRKDQVLSDLQKAEELIKQEMITMLHYDNLHNLIAVDNLQASKKPALTSPIQHLEYLENHPYEEFADEQLEIAKELLQKEMGRLKNGMGHGDLSLDVYTQVWEECLAQVLYLPTQNRYTRASLASKKERVEALEKKLDMNRNHMTKEAKKAAKLEWKLKIKMGGYQSRALMLIGQFNDLQDQIEKAFIELSTFKFLQKNEEIAIPKRIQALEDDVRRQTEREKALQKQFADLRLQLEE